MKILNLGLIVNFKETRGFSLYFKFFLEGNSQRVPSGTSPASPPNYISLSSPLSLIMRSTWPLADLHRRSLPGLQCRLGVLRGGQNPESQLSGDLGVVVA